VKSTLDVFNDKCCKNPQFTYLFTYLLIMNGVCIIGTRALSVELLMFLPLLPLLLPLLPRIVF